MADAFDYAEAKADADEMIAEFGQTGKLRRPTTTGPAYDPTEGSPSDKACTFVVLGYTNREIDGSRVLASDKKVLLAKGSLAIEPTTSDKLLIGGVVHSIVDVSPLSPGGTVVFYEMQVRR
jgi:hypothetical protein